jgi:hypothetical protein
LSQPIDDSLYGLPEPDQYPDTSFTQPLEGEDGEDDYDDVDDFGEQYDLWAQQVEAHKKPALFQVTDTLQAGPGTAADEQATGTGEGLTTGDRLGLARHQPSSAQQRTAPNPLLKKLTQQAAAGAGARSTTPDGFPGNFKKPNPLTYNPVVRQPTAAQKIDFHLPPLMPTTHATSAPPQAANKKRARPLRELNARARQPGMPDDSEDGETDVLLAAPLDYPEETLRGMSYADLQAEPFDAPAPGPSSNDRANDPAAADGKKEDEDGERKASVAARVEAAMADAPEQQELAFNAMTLSEWEEAGEWFVGRFADVVRRVVEVRGRKRRAAAGAEAAIAARNAAVEEAERETSVVLAGMKEQGREILRRRGAE